jgi:hypothetical protein
MEGEKVTSESSNVLPWTREEDGYIIGICKEKEMRDWRNELRAALPGRTWQEILKRMRYLGSILQKRRIVKSEGDEVGLRLRVYISRYAHLPEGSEDEIDEAEAIAHLEAYQRAAQGITTTDLATGGPEVGGQVDVDFGTPPSVDALIFGANPGSPNQTSVLTSSSEGGDSGADPEAEEVRVKCDAWTSDEDAAIRGGIEAGRSWKEISECLPGRTFFATKKRGHALGLKHREGDNAWTADEDATLRAGVEAGEPWKTIAATLPGRTACASKDRAKMLGIERSEKQVHVAWTEAEDAEIRAGVAAGEATAEIAKRLPGRTLRAVELRRAALREGEPPVAERWTEAEDAALREGFESRKSWKEIAEGVPGRTMNAVAARGINQLGLKRRKRGESEQPGQ